jgi:Ca2+-binding EF-hand superfamily protein
MKRSIIALFTSLITAAAFNAAAEAPAGKLARADTNGDGVISREEAKARPHLDKNFDKIDTNKDGVLSKDEIKAAHAKRAEHRFHRIDTDRDGRISRDEAKAIPRLAENFDRLDTNRDGFLSKEELAAARPARAKNGAMQ